MGKILIVEDEKMISDLIKMNLKMAGYESIQAADGEQGLQYLEVDSIDLLILDIMLPKIDGYSILPHAIEKKIPTIMLTASDSLTDKVYGLNLGADDYITKPFEGTELLARVQALLRRLGKDRNTKVIGDIAIHFKSRKVYNAGTEVELTLMEYKLLSYLFENCGIALSREKLLVDVWGFEFEGETRTVDIHIQKLRSKLYPLKIETVYKLGYRLEA